MSSDLIFEDTLIPVMPADQPTTSVYLRDLPVEISDEFARSALKAFGDVFSIRPTTYKDFPRIRNGTHILLMSVKQSILSSLNVLGFVCRAWCTDQPVVCTICRESGHLPRVCPLSGLCGCCKQPGHLARECVLAWGPSRPVTADLDPASDASEVSLDLSSVSSDPPVAVPDPAQSDSVPPGPDPATVPSVPVPPVPDPVTLQPAAKRALCYALSPPSSCSHLGPF